MISLLFAASLTPSFDCTKATALVEKAVCGSAQLSAKDKALSILYRKRGREPSVVQRQREWMRKRAQCQNVRCVEAAYDERIDDLGTGEDFPAKYASRANDGALSFMDLGSGWQLFSVRAFWSSSDAGPNDGSAVGVVLISGDRGVWKSTEG